MNQSLNERRRQIGADAASKLVASMMLQGSTTGWPPSRLWVSLSPPPRTGDAGVSVLGMVQDSSAPVHYICCPEDEQRAGWFDWF